MKDRIRTITLLFSALFHAFKFPLLQNLAIISLTFPIVSLAQLHTTLQF